MDPETGGLSSAERQRQTAAAIARKKVLAAYSSHAAPSRHLPVTAKDILVKDRPRATEPHPIAASAATAPNTEETMPHPTTAQPATSQPTPDQAPVLKDAPINTAKVSAEWQKYHSAWQNYYQNYYNNYYSKAAENYLATAKMKDERIATGQARKRRTLRRLLPVFIIGFVAASLAFSLCQMNGAFHPDATGKPLEPAVAKTLSNLFFSLAFVCVGLETRLKDIISRENRALLWSFLTAQAFNILITFLIACLLFGIVRPLWG